MLIQESAQYYSEALRQRAQSQPTRALKDIVWQICTIELLIDQYLDMGFDVPKSMTEELATLRRQANSAYRAEMESNLAAAKRKAEALKSREMQREEAEKEVARLEALLAEKGK